MPQCSGACSPSYPHSEACTPKLILATIANTHVVFFIVPHLTG
ncbi:Uncharacterised protein [Vibrio cholerae]|nr:Uncharacterised protein [Vibrio cholerae]